MKNTTLALCLPLALLFLFNGGRANEKLVRTLERKGAEFVSAAAERGRGDGVSAFKIFTELLTAELRDAGDPQSAVNLEGALQGRNDSLTRNALAWAVQTFAREFYREKIIEATSQLIRFRTVAGDVPNRLNPEFIRQKEFLRTLSASLGLGFRDVDGYVQEIWIGGGGEPFGLMVHSDVQPVDETEWTHPPWEGEVKDGAIWGRGSIDDKGALVAIMYGMRAILDSGVPLRNRLIILVGTDEESANEDIATYLKTNEAPARTIVVDYAYPLYCAEKGWCGVWMKAARGRVPADGGIVLTEVQSGFSPSIVPGTAVATFLGAGLSADSVERRLRDLAARFMEERAGSNLRIGRNEDAVVVTAAGRSVHSSVPGTGHNALMDMLVWVDRYVEPVVNNTALMAKFASTYIGFELDGRSLGIAHTDPFMGEVTVAGDMFHTDADSLLFMFNFRVPKGVEIPGLRRTIENQLAAFSASRNIDFSSQMYFSEPFYKDPDSPFIRKLLGIYGAVTGEKGEAHSMGGGTYARRIPNAVVFGPSLHDDEYLGHQPDEHITLGALDTNIAILTHTLVEFGLE